MFGCLAGRSAVSQTCLRSLKKCVMISTSELTSRVLACFRQHGFIVEVTERFWKQWISVYWLWTSVDSGWLFFFLFFFFSVRSPRRKWFVGCDTQKEVMLLLWTLRLCPDKLSVSPPPDALFPGGMHGDLSLFSIKTCFEEFSCFDCSWHLFVEQNIMPHFVLRRIWNQLLYI